MNSWRTVWQLSPYLASALLCEDFSSRFPISPRCAGEQAETTQKQVAANVAKSHRKDVAGERDGTKAGRSSGTAATAMVSLFPGLNVWDLKLCLP